MGGGDHIGAGYAVRTARGSVVEGGMNETPEFIAWEAAYKALADAMRAPEKYSIRELERRGTALRAAMREADNASSQHPEHGNLALLCRNTLAVLRKKILKEQARRRK